MATVEASAAAALALSRATIADRDTDLDTLDSTPSPPLLPPGAEEEEDAILREKERRLGAEGSEQRKARQTLNVRNSQKMLRKRQLV